MSGLNVIPDSRMLAGQENNEDAAILQFPAGMALVQTVDFFTPIVNNPFWFGQIAAANSLSDVYAMGGQPYAAMNILCFPSATLSNDILKEVLKGGLSKIQESGAMLAGGHSVEDQEFKYGLSVSGIISPDHYATNAGLTPGDTLILTKPLGTGVLATALKAKWEGYEEIEKELYRWASHLNAAGGEVIRQLKLKGATDVTGFGLGGHLLEMCCGSKACVELWLDSIPFIDQAVELAGIGLMPAGSFANKSHCIDRVEIDSEADPIKADLIFDAQTSGGLVLSVPEAKVAEAIDLLHDKKEMAACIGRVRTRQEQTAHLRIAATKS